MKIAFRHTDGACSVAVLGRQEHEQARNELLDVIDSDVRAHPQISDDASVELCLYDANHLSRSLLQALARRMDRNARLRIVAYNPLMAHSLMRLNIPVHRFYPPKPAKRSLQIRAIALAGSAQSLDKICRIVENLPVADLAVFVAQHVPEHQPNLLDKLLKSRTDYEVLMPTHLAAVRPGTIYIAPPAHHMKVANGLVYLTRDRLVQHARPSIDVLFESVAAEYGPSAIAALLCGYGRDGTAGCASLREAGAVVIVEDPEECAPASAMPGAARDAQCFDYILRASAIVSVLAALAMRDKAQPTSDLLELFLAALADHYGYELRGYQRESLGRRLSRAISKYELGTFAEFQLAVFSDADLLNQFSVELPVGVTQFFRHPEQLSFLRKEVFPYLASFPTIKVWSAGCSTGEEPYSIAIILSELGLLARSQVFATDVNAHQLEQAGTGLFPLAAQQANEKNYVQSGGSAALAQYLSVGTRYLHVAETLRERILFHRHSLLDDGIFNEFQLIVCRNVLIYFDHHSQQQVLERFARSLHSDGFLVLGPQDGIHGVASAAGFVPFRPGSHVYRFKPKAVHNA